MGSAVAEKKSVNRKSQKQVSKVQKSKLMGNKIGRSKPFPWKLVFGVVVIIGVMALLSNPIDPNSFKNGSSKTDQGGLSGFTLER